MKFNGLVLYSPTTEESQLLRDILDIHLKTKPDIKEISKRNSKEKFFGTKYNFVEINREVQNLSLGWKWDTYKYGFEERRFYSSPTGWVNSLSNVVIMLSINTECYITPKQSGDIFVASVKYNAIHNAKS